MSVRRQRLRSLKALLAETIQQLNDLADDQNQSSAKRANAVFVKADILMSLLNNQVRETQSRLKHGKLDDEDEKPAPSVPSTQSVTESFEERLARLTGGSNA